MLGWLDVIEAAVNGLLVLSGLLLVAALGSAVLAGVGND